MDKANINYEIMKTLMKMEDKLWREILIEFELSNRFADLDNLINLKKASVEKFEDLKNALIVANSPKEYISFLEFCLGDKAREGAKGETKSQSQESTRKNRKRIRSPKKLHTMEKIPATESDYETSQF